MAPSTFVFLGVLSEVLGAGIKLERFGQRVELPPDLAEQTAHNGGLPCIPAADFDAIGFTPEELKRYAKASSHEREEIQPSGEIKVFKAPDTFLAKKARALAILHDRREQAAAAPPVPASIPNPSEGGE